MEQFSYTVKNLDDTKLLAKRFANVIKNKNGTVVCLNGDIGAGKTTFSKYVCEYLNVKEKVTSPSFIILNEYKSGDIPVYHFDLYRLEKEGVLSIISELYEYTSINALTFIEWYEFSDIKLPFNFLELNISYLDETSRVFNFKSNDDKNNTIIKALLYE